MSDTNNSKRIEPRQYNLSNMQLSLLMGDDIGTRKEANLEAEIEETAKRVHSRLEYLFEDISLYYSNGLLTQDSDIDQWVSIKNMTRNDELYDEPSMYNSVMPETIDYMRLAINFGHICRLLYSEKAPEYDEEKIAMGFLIGLTGGWLKEHAERSTSDDQMAQPILNDETKIKEFQMPSEETFQNLRKLLSDANNSVQQHKLEIPSKKTLRTAIRDSDLVLTPSLYTYAENEFDQGPYYGINGLVSNLESNKDIKKADMVAEQIEKDISELLKLKWRGTSAIDIFSAVGSNKETEITNEVAKVAGSKNQQTKKLINDLSGRSPPWNKRPIIKEGERGFVLTKYGNFIYQLMTSNEGGQILTSPSTDKVLETCHNAVLNQDENEKANFIRELTIE